MSKVDRIDRVVDMSGKEIREVFFTLLRFEVVNIEPWSLALEMLDDVDM